MVHRTSSHRASLGVRSSVIFRLLTSHSCRRGLHCPDRCPLRKKKVGCLVGWLSGCLVVWLFGCVVVWLCGCLVVWLFVCLLLIILEKHKNFNMTLTS